MSGMSARPKSKLFLDRDIRSWKEGEGGNVIDTPPRCQCSSKTHKRHQRRRRSGGSRCQDVIDEPIAADLPEGRIAKKPGGEEHFVGGLEHSLQMRWISLGQ